MSIYVCENLARSPIFRQFDTNWLATSPITFSTTFPILLDLAESLNYHFPNAFNQQICDVIAPNWDVFDGMDLYDLCSRLEGDAVFVAETESEETALSSSIAMALKLRDENLGVIFRDPQKYDIASLRFCRRVLQESILSGFDVAIEGPRSLSETGPIADLLSNSTYLPSLSDSKMPPPTSSALSMVAICDHALPMSVLENCGLSWPDESCHTVIGPTGERWAVCDQQWAAAARAKLSPEQTARLHHEIFENWNCNNWGYLRRISHALKSGDRNLAISTHYPMLHSIPWISRDLTYSYLVELMKLLDRTSLDQNLLLHCLIGSAKLAPYVSIDNGFDAAINHWLEALQLTSEPNIRVRLMVQLANIYAVQKTKDHLVKSRHWHTQGFKELSQVTDPRIRHETRLQLLNGLALVEYHSRNSRRALKLELRARESAESNSKDFPDIARWAMQLLNSNTAKLAHRRFANTNFALSCLQENANIHDLSSAGRAIIELSSFHFDRHDYISTVNTLTTAIDRGDLLKMSDNNALLCRLMFVVSLVKIGDHLRVRQELPSLIRDCRRQSAKEATVFLDALEKNYL